LIQRHRQVLIDVTIAALIVAMAGVWGARFWDTWVARGGKPSFYQSYFEPAVMIACGKGFVISHPVQPKPLEDFLFQRRDALSCSELPPDLTVGRQYLYQEAWTYLQWTVGLAWRLLGISWSGMSPLFGLFFGLTIALSYGVFRLGMGRVAATVCAAFLAVSSTHLLNLPHLRDYSKAPFTMALILILGLLVSRPVRPRTVLGLAFAYGAVLGIGYGFRTDFLANLPLLVIVVFAFLDGGVTRNLMLKAGATVLFVVTFIGVSWPASSAVYQKGGCQWHVVLLGLQSPFDVNLGITAAPYNFGDAYADGYIESVVTGYARRTQPGFNEMVYCSHEYDVHSGGYLADIATTFPADLSARAYASTLQVADLPFSLEPPIPNWATPIYRFRARVLNRIYEWGGYFVAGVIVVAAAINIRVGLFLLFFLAYFGGYPSLQFQTRHFFHLEFITWWAFGVAGHYAFVQGRALIARRPDAAAARAFMLRVGAVGAALAVVVVGYLAMIRWYQAGQVQALIHAYLAAPKIPVTDPSSPLVDIPARDWPQYLEVQLNESACGGKAAVTFRYDPARTDLDFTRTVSVAHRADAQGITRVLMPVFDRFRGLEIPDDRPGCFVGASRFADVRSFPILLGATLPPDWERLPLYQRLTAWEGDGRP
jgi:hypothetical protein